MNTLFITHHYLSSKGGGSFASRAYINAFADLSDSMVLLYPVKGGENTFDGINDKIELIPVPNSIPKWKKMLHLLFGKVHRFSEEALEMLKSRYFDVVVFDTSIVSFGLIDHFRSVGSKVITIHHNYQYEYFRDNTQGFLKIPVLFWCRRYEREAVRKADMNLTLTEDDSRELAYVYNNGNRSRFRVLGTFEFKPFTLPETGGCRCTRNHFVITGALDAIQTRDSLIPWIEDFYPILLEFFPDAHLTIAGRNPGADLVNLCRKKGIELVASPASMDSVLMDADFYICPVSLGGGIKLRMMDGLKWGLPVLVHRVSARGYDVFVERNMIFPYSEKKDFMIQLEKMKALRFSREDIQRQYSSIFSFASGKERLNSIISEII